MKKRILSLLLVLFTISICLFGGCGVALSEDDRVNIENAYLRYLNEEKRVYDSVKVVKYAGDYYGNKVAVVRWFSNEVMVIEAVIDYTVDEVLIYNLPNPSYDIIVYTVDKTIIDLKTAYSDGIITRRNLLSIKSALKK